MKITVALLNVEHPGNLGAVCRVMKNFGLSKLLLIEPKCDKGESEAKRRAKWAGDVLEEAQIAKMDALDRFDLVVGTTGKIGNDYNLPRSPFFPDQLAEMLSGGVDGEVCLLFGRESDGLRNEELKRCDFVVTIPTSKKYRSMNLSHAVALLLYTITFHKREEEIAERFPLLKAPEKRALLKEITKVLDNLHFSTPEKRETQEILWKRIVGKSMLTQREAMALFGFFKKIKR